MLTAATMALSSSTMARYTAGAQVQAQGRVASWNPVWTPRDPDNLDNIGGLGALSTGIVFHPGNWTTARHVDWRVDNNGEVAMESYMVPMAVTGTGRAALAATHFGNRGTLTLNTARTPQTAVIVPINGHAVFRFSYQSVAVTRPTALTNNVGLITSPITHEEPIRFGVGSSNYNVSTLWRTVRINADGHSAQLD